MKVLSPRPPDQRSVYRSIHQHRSPGDSSLGYALPTTLAAASIIILSSIALSAAGTQALSGSARQYQGTLAEDIAESGASEILENLNSRNRYLLVRNLASWSSPISSVTVCPGSSAISAESIPTAGTIRSSSGKTTGKYILNDYTFKGSQYFGGVGRLDVTGQALDKSGNVTATASVVQEIDILPKTCNSYFGSPPSTSGFPGLMAETISLGNADVLGNVNGNILCTKCTSTTAAALTIEINKLAQSVVNGNIFAGRIPLPSVPAPPSAAILPATGPSITSSRTFTALSSNKLSSEAQAPCWVDTSASPQKTYCKISSVTLNGGNKNLIFDTTNGPIDVYFTGNVSVTGTAAVVHSGSYKNLSFYGNNDLNNSLADQSFVIGGGSNAINAFVFMPDASVGINGGSATPDLRGAIWAKTFGVLGSSSNMADVQIPDDFGKGLKDSKGDDFNISIRDFKGAGSRFWSTHAK